MGQKPVVAAYMGCIPTQADMGHFGLQIAAAAGGGTEPKRVWYGGPTSSHGRVLSQTQLPGQAEVLDRPEDVKLTLDYGQMRR